MRYLAFDEVTRLHTLLIKQSGGMDGLRDSGGLESAAAGLTPPAAATSTTAAPAWYRRPASIHG